MAKKIIKVIWDKKAEDIVLLNLKKISGVTDYFVICTAGSDIQARTIADAVMTSLKGREIILHTEGYEGARWILIDCFSVVLHIFRPEARAFYALEKFWGDAPREDYPDGIK
ncbi:MAG: ribosome silencing factor [Candidatus Krumholzibacteriota bacterium]|nr:ribosome silencing factor [Candidatus Krumholzibacteriota bacterium]